MGIAGNSRGFFRKLLLLIRRDRFRSELSEEMAFHRIEREQELEAEGMTPKQAHRAAAREFGNLEQLKERSTEAIGFRFEIVFQDLRFALRQLRRNPGFAATAIFILALGIGASVAIFAFVDAALIQPLPYRDPARLMDVTESIQSYDVRANLSYPDYLDWKRRNTVFDSLDIYNGNGFLMSTPDGPKPMSGVRVSDGFFKTLGVNPLLGRDFRPGEDLPGTADIVILSYRGWQKFFGGRRDVIGTKVTLNGTPNTIIGVLPESFDFAPTGLRSQSCLPQPERHCPAQERRRLTHGARRNAIDRLATGARVSRIQSRPGSVCRIARGRDRRRLPFHPAHAAGRSRTAAGHRLHQRRQPAVGALGKQATRICLARRSGSYPYAVDPPVCC